MRIFFANRIVPLGLVLATVLLASCGGSNHQDAAILPTPSPSTDDAFISIVRVQTDGMNAMSETADPIDTSRIMETSPENTEPQVVKF